MHITLHLTHLVDKLPVTRKKSEMDLDFCLNRPHSLKTIIKWYYFFAAKVMTFIFFYSHLLFYLPLQLRENQSRQENSYDFP